MGCDIHGFWEVKDHTGNWIAFQTVNPERNYTWFGIIAAVRGGPDIGTASRGVPGDASGAYKDMVEAWGVDLHSHTWLTSNEVHKACGEFSNRMVEAYSESYEEAYEDVPAPDDNVDQLIVGWGDNRDNIAWTWFGKLKDLMYPGGTTNDCLRMVICFDS